MTILDLDEEKITHRQQIIQLLKMAIAQEWEFSCVSVVRKRVNTQPIKLLSVNVKEGTFSINNEISASNPEAIDSIIFRGESGGVSVAFKSQAAEADEDADPGLAPRGFQIRLPYEVRCTQLRSSPRVDMESLEEEVPVTLYLSMGLLLEGTLVDISTSGARIRVESDQLEKFKNPEVLDACRINLAEDFILQSGAQLLGVSYDSGLDCSILRCQFNDLQQLDVQRLETFVNKALENT